MEGIEPARCCKDSEPGFVADPVLLEVAEAGVGDSGDVNPALGALGAQPVQGAGVRRHVGRSVPLRQETGRVGWRSERAP